MVKKKIETTENKIESLSETEKTSEKKEIKKISQTEFEKEVHKLADKGLTAEKIGEELRKKGIHSKEYSGKISKILGNKYISPDLKNVEEKLKKLEEHFDKNKQDKRAKREKDRIISKLRKMKKHLNKE
jgi:ribosomal protein S15P/S13E